MLAMYPGALAAVLELMHTKEADNEVVCVHIVRHLAIIDLGALLVGIGGTDNQPVATVTLDSAETARIALFLAVSLIAGRWLGGRGAPSPYLFASLERSGRHPQQVVSNHSEYRTAYYSRRLCSFPYCSQRSCAM